MHIMDVEHDISVAGRRVVVTGGAGGIGKAIVWGLARNGARVVALDISQTAAARLDTDAQDAGLDLTCDIVDVADESSVRDGFAGAAARLDGLDVVFANAGIAGTVGPLHDWTLEQWRQVIGVNLDGAFLTARQAVRLMGRGDLPGRKIVFTASVWGQRGSTTAPCPGYSASKAGVIGLTKQLAADLAPQRITVNAIAPSGFLTDIAGGVMHDQAAATPMLARQPWHTFVRPDAAVGLALFLTSRSSDHMTGHVLALDGGYLAV